MRDEEFMRGLAMFMDAIERSRKPEDYVINPLQYEKFVRAFKFFRDAGKDFEGGIESIRLNPVEISGGITADFLLMDFYGSRLREFNEILSYASAVSVDALTNGRVSIGITIPDIFVSRKETEEF